MHFTTSFILAFIAATSAPSLAAPIPSHESDVEHAHGYSGHSHRHVARSPLLATLVKAQNQAPKPTAPKPKGKNRRSFDVDDFQELEARSPLNPGPKTPSTPRPSPGKPSSKDSAGRKKKQRRALTLDLEPRSPLFAAVVKAQSQTPKTATPKSKNKHRRSFDFDDFQELEARSPVPGGAPSSPVPKTPTSSPKPASLVRSPTGPIKGKPKRRDLTLDLEPRSPLFAAAVKAQGTPKTPAPKSKGKQRRSFEFDDFQELEARSPTPTSKNPSSPKPSAIPPPRSSVAPAKGKPRRRDLTLDLEARGLLAAAIKAQNQALKGPTPQAKNAPAKKGHRRRSFELEIDELD